MSKFLNSLALICVTALVGCGSGSDEQTGNVALTLYDSEDDYYLQITDSGEVRYLTCSIHDGYDLEESFSGKYTGDQLTITAFGNEYDLRLTQVDGIYTLVDVEDEATVLDEASEVPTVCVNDAIEITSFSPERAVAGVETEFVVNYDYRLVSADTATIFSFLSSPSIGGIFDDKLEISAGTRSGSFTKTLVPVNGEEIEATLFVAMNGAELNDEGEQILSVVDFASIDIAAPIEPIISQSYIGTWVGDCLDIDDFSGLDSFYGGSNSRKLSRVYSENTIIQTYSYFSDHSCMEPSDSLVSNYSYTDKGSIYSPGGVEVSLLETRSVSGNSIGEPKEEVVFVYNNVLVDVDVDEESGEFYFGTQYQLQ